MEDQNLLSDSMNGKLKQATLFYKNGGAVGWSHSLVAYDRLVTNSGVLTLIYELFLCFSSVGEQIHKSGA